MPMHGTTMEGEVAITLEEATGTAMEAPDTILVSRVGLDIIPDTRARAGAPSPSPPPELTPAARGHSPDSGLRGA